MNELIEKIKTNTDDIRKSLDDYYSLYIDDVINKEDYIAMYSYLIDKLIDLSSLVYSLLNCDIITFTQCETLIDYVDKQLNNCLNLYTVA